MASSPSTVRLMEIFVHQDPANSRSEPVPKPPRPSKTRNPHRPSPLPRGFVHGRFSYAGRHPKTFTIQVLQRNPPGAPKRAFMQTCLVTEVGGFLPFRSD